MPDLCNRCLVIVDARTTVRAYGTGWNEDCPVPTNPRTLINWVEAMAVKGAERFSIDAQDWAFEPVSTWHGDPVCVIHLWECRDREWGRRV